MNSRTGQRPTQPEDNPMTDLIQAATAAADLIDTDVLALAAVINQVAEMAEATDSFAAYWAGSISASVGHHYAAGAVRTVGA
jgi:hypothetical protein